MTRSRYHPTFIITTEIFRCREVIYGFDKARDDFMQRVRKSLTELERLTGRVFAAPKSPLLLSVRSGAAVSMPGMMATVHNVGTNEELIEEAAREHGDSYLAWDNYRRFFAIMGYDFRSSARRIPDSYG